jgi:hypothetical protein
VGGTRWDKHRRFLQIPRFLFRERGAQAEQSGTKMGVFAILCWCCQRPPGKKKGISGDDQIIQHPSIPTNTDKRVLRDMRGMRDLIAVEYWKVADVKVLVSQT